MVARRRAKLPRRPRKRTQRGAVARKKLEETLRTRVDAQLMREVKRAQAEMEKRMGAYHTVDQSVAVRYLIRLGLAAGAEGFAVGPDGKLRWPDEDEK